MSLALFNSVSAGAIKILYDDQSQPWFERAGLGRFLGIRNIRDNFKDFPLHLTRTRSKIGVGQYDTLGKRKNPHDVLSI